MIIPQATAGTFTLQSVGQPAAFVSYAAAARKVPGHSQTVASGDLQTFTVKMIPCTKSRTHLGHFDRVVVEYSVLKAKGISCEHLKLLVAPAAHVSLFHLACRRLAVMQ